MSWRLPIFPGRHQPSIFGTTELNFRVRDGNGWTLSVIGTNYPVGVFPHSIYYTRTSVINSLKTFEPSQVRFQKSSERSGDSCGNRPRMLPAAHPSFRRERRASPLVLETSHRDISFTESATLRSCRFRKVFRSEWVHRAGIEPAYRRMSYTA